MLGRIKQLLRSSDLNLNGNVSDFARKIGMEQTTVNNQIKGKRGVSLELVNRILATYSQVSAEWLMRGVGEMILVENTSQGENRDYAHICKQMADMYEEIQKLRAEISLLKAKRGETAA